MKKIVFVLLGAFAYVGLTYYSGIVGERYIKKQVAMAKKQHPMQGELSVSDYHRGIFKSTFKVNFDNNGEQLQIDSLSLNSDVEVFHGPVIFADGVKFGWFYALSENNKIQSSNSDITQMLTKLFPQGVGHLNMLGTYGGSLDSSWHSGALTYQEDDVFFEVDGITINGKGTFGSQDAKGDLYFGKTQFTSDMAEITATPLEGQWKYTMTAEGVPISSSSATLKKVTFSPGSSKEASLNNVEMMQHQEIDKTYLNSSMKMTVKNFTGPFAAQDLYYELALDKMPMDAMVAWSQLSKEMSAAQENLDFAQFEPKMLEVLAKMAHKDISLTSKFGGKALDGYANANMQLGFDSKIEGSIGSIKEYVAFLKGNMKLIVSEEIVAGTPLQFLITPYVGTYIIQKDNEYIVDAKISEGQLWIADTSFSLKQYLGLGDAYL
ncbi:DUF945 family protein [Gilvimarinus japonicus]|uniref:DUF945 family protein n=1 Tax=Gilvimarinus japonicus TaxID=1796469 RepID=A0ABV7HS86_9GAMM